VKFINEAIHTRHGGPLKLIIDSFADKAVVTGTSFTLAVTYSVDNTTVSLFISRSNMH